MTNKFKIGDKVIPISKTAKYWESDDVWQDDKAKQQGYLYVTGIDGNKYTCRKTNTTGGNYYNECDLISYEEEFILPEKWCIKITKENYDILYNYWKTLKSGFTHFEGWLLSDRHDGSYQFWGERKPEGYTQITFDHFKQHVLKTKDSINMLKTNFGLEWFKNNGYDIGQLRGNADNGSVYYIQLNNILDCRMKDNVPEDITILTLKDVLNMNKKIIGYKAPYGLFNGEVPKYTLYVINGHGTEYVRKDLGGKNLPKEIVEQWEPVYKEEEYQVGDWVICQHISYNDGKEFIGKLSTCIGYGDIAWVENHNIQGHYNAQEYRTVCVNGSILRKATAEEIQKVTTKTISVGGQFNVTIKPNGIFHGWDNITTFVEDMMNTFHPEQSLGDYSATIKEVIFSKTGCQNKETKLSDWKQVWDEYNKLKK